MPGLNEHDFKALVADGTLNKAAYTRCRTCRNYISNANIARHAAACPRQIREQKERLRLQVEAAMEAEEWRMRLQERGYSGRRF